MIKFFQGAMIITVGNYYFTWSIYGEVHPHRYNLPRFYWFSVTELDDCTYVNAPFMITLSRMFIITRMTKVIWKPTNV